MPFPTTQDTITKKVLLPKIWDIILEHGAELSYDEFAHALHVTPYELLGIFATRKKIFSGVIHWQDDKFSYYQHTASSLLIQDPVERLFYLLDTSLDCMPGLHSFIREFDRLYQIDDDINQAWSKRISMQWKTIQATIIALHDQGLLHERWSVNKATHFVFINISFQLWDLYVNHRKWSHQDAKTCILNLVNYAVLKSPLPEMNIDTLSSIPDHPYTVPDNLLFLKPLPAKEHQARDEILSKAWEVIAEHGADLELSEIASAGNIDAKQLQDMFPDQARFIVELLNWRDDSYDINTKLIAVLQEKDALLRLDKALKIWLNFIPHIHPIVSQLIALRFLNPAIDKALQYRANMWRTTFHTIISSLSKQGKLANNFSINHAVDYAFISTSVELWDFYHRISEFDHEAIYNTMYDQVTHALLIPFRAP